MIELLNFIALVMISPLIVVVCFIPIFIIEWIEDTFGCERKKKRNHYSVKVLDDNDTFRKYEEEYVRRKSDVHNNSKLNSERI